MQLPKTCYLPLVRSFGRKVEQQRPHLRAQEVVGAGCPERREARRGLRGEEVEHDVRVVEVPDHWPVVSRDAANRGPEQGSAVATLVDGKSGERRPRRAERIGPAVFRQIALGLLDQGQRERARRPPTSRPRRSRRGRPGRPLAGRACPRRGRAAEARGRSRAAASRASRAGPRRPPRPAPARPPRSRTRSERRGGGGRRVVRGGTRAAACRSRGRRPRARSARGRADRPSRPRGRARRRPAPSRAGARGRRARGPRRSACRGRRPSP